MAWAREWTKEGVKVYWERFMLAQGFQVVPRRWVVERTFMVGQNRRMSKDYERLPESGEAFIYVAPQGAIHPYGTDCKREVV